MASVYIVYSDDNRVAAVFRNEPEAIALAYQIRGEYDEYTINDDVEEEPIEYLVVPLLPREYRDVMEYAVEKSVSPAAFVRALILDELAR